jgi:hypothetical protein
MMSKGCPARGAQTRKNKGAKYKVTARFIVRKIDIGAEKLIDKKKRPQSAGEVKPCTLVDFAFLIVDCNLLYLSRESDSALSGSTSASLAVRVK